MKTIIIFFLAFSTHISLAKEVSFFATPIASRLAGVGFIYGAAAGANGLYNDNINIYAAKSLGEIDGEGILLNKVPLFIPNINLSLMYGNINSSKHETTYARGFNESLLVKQKSASKVVRAAIEFSFYEEQFKVIIAKAKSTLEFNGYEDMNGNSIPFSLSTLHDVESDIASIGLDINLKKGKGRFTPSFKFNPKLSSIKGRVAQSDIRIFDYITSAHLPILSNSKLVLYMQGSHSSISRKDETSPDIVNGSCSSISNNDLKSKCLQLETDLKNYIRESNKYGTAIPLGGSRGLRSYRELRFKSAHNHLSGLELQTLIIENPEIHISPFLELGHSNDRGSELLKHGRYSTGIALRLYVKDIPIRLEAATGNEGTEYFFTAGLPW